MTVKASSAARFFDVGMIYVCSNASSLCSRFDLYHKVACWVAY